jgi:hypothetical protein
LDVKIWLTRNASYVHLFSFLLNWNFLNKMNEYARCHWSHCLSLFVKLLFASLAFNILVLNNSIRLSEKIVLKNKIKGEKEWSEANEYRMKTLNHMTSTSFGCFCAWLLCSIGFIRKSITFGNRAIY